MGFRGAALCLIAAVCLAQDFRTEVHLVNVGFSVRDAGGQFVTTLAQNDFEVFEDGAPQKIAFFARSADVPLDLGLIADFSGSQEEFVKPHHKDLDTFLKKVLTPRDRAFLVCFGNHIRLAQDYTASPGELIDGLHYYEKGSYDFPELGPRERRTLGTAFYDAIFYAIEHSVERSVEQGLAASEHTRKALVIFSDGEDNSSGHHMMEAIEAAQSNDVLLFPIRYTETLKGGPIARNRYGAMVMSRIAKETGGADFNAREKGLASDFEQIGEQLRSSYQIAYHSTNPQSDESFRKVQIRVKQAGYTVRAKTGYYAK
jgi:Ca-activated chloride channel family protein